MDNLFIKKGGSAYIVVPDGIMNRTSDKKLRDFIIKKCIINGIISLPNRTFFATPKQTYILSITKKQKNTEIQDTPVFTYLISEIGESRDSKRFNIEKNDLEDMAIKFRQFMATKKQYKSDSDRCKIQELSRFSNSSSWMIEKDWSEEERKKLGLENETSEISESDFVEKVKEAHDIVSRLYRIVKRRK